MCYYAINTRVLSQKDNWFRQEPSVVDLVIHLLLMAPGIGLISPQSPIHSNLVYYLFFTCTYYTYL